MIELIIVAVAILATGYLIVKKVDAAVALLVVGLALFMVAPFLGHTDTGTFEVEPSGNAWYDQLQLATAIFSDRFANTGLVIMMLFGFAAYMSHIGANDKAVDLLTRPLLKLRVKYLLVPIVFWVGNLMSLVVPSASSLAVLLMATLYPMMVGAGLSRLTSGAVIATTATIVPTPLGADNVIAADRLALDLGEYVFSLHARVSIPTLVVMGVAHYFWQRWMDSRDARRGRTLVDEAAGGVGSVAAEDAPRGSVPGFYAILPVLPLLLVLVPYVLTTVGVIDFQVSLLPIVLVSLMAGLVVEAIRKRQLLPSLNDLKVFFRGIGDGAASVVALLIAAGIFVEAITQLGIIDSLVAATENIEGAALVLMLVFVGATILLVLLTGSGLAPFYSFIEVIPRIAGQTGINGVLLALPIQFAGNLARAVSPVSAVVLIVSRAMNANVIDLVKRTVVPMAVGIVVSIALTWILIPGAVG
ncbi:C4-dicarboxylate transporter DcuC [Rothia sp. AR01]|uniref:C4-dicarboxylate transporter DcuC n=1 Tax=Rothia santali TaxID=2949643 RepID=A0A9X2KGT3_9MICC|nr:C4-dicarboxylate transporter DcuC [Rothia santali]MCP3424463.1 C4-dicarboxylate transporter DcuC [Rothia santali]